MLNLYPISLNRKDLGEAFDKLDGELKGKHVLAWKYCSHKWSKARALFSDSLQANKYWHGLNAHRRIRHAQIWGLHAASALWLAGSMALVTVRFLPGVLVPLLVFKNRSLKVSEAEVIDV